MGMCTRRGVRSAAVLTAAAALMLVHQPLASAQTPFVPYFGKNQIRYDHFDWRTYETDHFTIYYYSAVAYSGCSSPRTSAEKASGVGGGRRRLSINCSGP